MEAKGVLSRKLRVFILLWIFLQNVVVSFGGNLLQIYFKKAETNLTDSPFYVCPPDYWLGGGAVVGGILILTLCKSLNMKIYFCGIRYFQSVAIALIITFYKFKNHQWAKDYWIIGMYSTFLIQGVADSMSQILTPSYIMETICDRDLDESVEFLLLVTTVLPIYMSSLLAQLLSGNHLFLTVGVGIFGGIFVLVSIFYIFLPRTTQEGEPNDKTDYIDYWHLQFEAESGWFFPATTAIGLCLLPQLSGFQVYEFYSSWSLRLAGIPVEAKLLITSTVSFFSLLIAILIWSKEKLPFFLIISTAVLSICSFMYGIFLHGLEGGGTIYRFAPLSVYIVYIIAYVSGLGSLDKVVSVLIIPRNYRLTILTIAIVFSMVTQKLAKAAIPALLENLYPFGVFWLFAGILLIGLVYIVIGVTGQIKNRNNTSIPGQRTVEEFITQV